MKDGGYLRGIRGEEEAFALMAKLVRHLTCNEKIGGSNPPESTRWLVRHVKKTTSPIGVVMPPWRNWIARWTSNPKVASSNLVGGVFLTRIIYSDSGVKTSDTRLECVRYTGLA